MKSKAPQQRPSTRQVNQAENIGLSYQRETTASQPGERPNSNKKNMKMNTIQKEQSQR